MVMPSKYQVMEYVMTHLSVALSSELILNTLEQNDPVHQKDELVQAYR